MAAQTMLRVEHLSKAYKLYSNKTDRLKEAISLSRKQFGQTFYALKDISFEVQRGETVGIIGSNGSGKSTLLKILTGVVNATSGHAEVHGHVSALLELGTGFNPEYTGVENIYLHGTMMGYSKEEIEQRKDGIIQFADIGDYIDQPVKNYSSGMFARLAFAVAISVEPEVLIVDEALSVGDVFFQSKCFRKFDELCAKGATILFVSHDIGSVRKMCSRVLWIEKGEQQMFGECNAVCNAYFNEQMRRMNEQNKAENAAIATVNKRVKSEAQTEAFPALNVTVDSVLSPKAEILSTYVRDASGQFVSHMEAGGEYAIGIVTKYNEDMSDVIVGFTLNNSKGLVLLSTNTFMETNEGIRVDAGAVLVTEFRLRAPQMRSGLYEVSPAIAIGTQENHAVLTWLHGVLGVQFERQGYELSEIGAEYTLTNRQIDNVQLL